MRLPITLLSLALSLFPSTSNAIFADEAGVIDYQHQLIGLPQEQTTFFYRPKKDEKGSLLYSLSDLGVLGAVNPGTGAVVWRQPLYGDGLGLLRGVEGDGTVVSALGKDVRAWDAMSGKERWGNGFHGEVRDLEIVETTAGSTQEKKDVLVLYDNGGKGYLRRLKGLNGDVIWEHADETGDLPFQISTNVIEIFLVSLHGTRGGYNLKITTLDPVTGKKTDEYILASKGDIHGPEDVLLVGANSAAPIIAWTDKAMKELKVNILGKKPVHTLALKESDGELVKVTLHAPHLVQSQPHFLVHSQSAVSNRADVYHINPASHAITKAYELPKLAGKGAVSTSSQDGNVYFTRLAGDEVVIVSSASHGILGRWPLHIEKDHGEFLHAASEVVARTADTYAVRSAVATTNDDWMLVHNGVEAWSRVEGLSGAIAAEWAEFSEAEGLAKSLEVEAHSNPISAYIHRVNRHIDDLQYLPAYLQNLPERFLSSILPRDPAPKLGVSGLDTFGFNKLIVVATERGRVYGLDVGNRGDVVWTVKAIDIPAGKKWDVKGIWVENSKGLVAIRGADGDFIVIKTASGETVEAITPGSLPPVQSTAVVDSPSGKWLLPIGINGDPGHVSKDWAPKDGLVVRGEGDEVKGLKFEIEGDDAVPVDVWSFRPPSGQKVTNVIARPAHDPVASIGRVLGDRTVLYKFLNPNLLLVTAVSNISSTASFYLLDSVSGDILYSTTHEAVDNTQPITSTITENWFAYSLWSDVLPTTDRSTSISTSKGYQLVITELYESALPNDRGPLNSSPNASSLEPTSIPNAGPPLPHILTQTYLIPSAITYMTVSQTLQGITSRQLLCTLPSGAIVGIPRHLLDARRPVGRDPTAAEQEEGLLKYAPFIDFDPKMIITHRREPLGVKKVITSPALLESTSLLFAYGIDVFGTRVTPSAPFDILGKGFNKLSLVVTVAALGVGVAVLAPMVRRKQINTRWTSS